MARARRTDGNHTKISGAARDLGCSWRDTHMVGDGFPDGVLGLCNQNKLIEIKDDAQYPSDRKLNDNEQKFHNEWKGDKPVVIENVEQLVELVQTIRREHAGRVSRT